MILRVCNQTIPEATLSTCVDGSSCIKTESIYIDSPVPIPIDTPESNCFERIRKLSAEFLGSAILVTVIVGSGIMAQRLSPNDVGLQLLKNGISVSQFSNTFAGISPPSVLPFIGFQFIGTLVAFGLIRFFSTWCVNEKG